MFRFNHERIISSVRSINWYVSVKSDIWTGNISHPLTNAQFIVNCNSECLITQTDGVVYLPAVTTTLQTRYNGIQSTLEEKLILHMALSSGIKDQDHVSDH